MSLVESKKSFEKPEVLTQFPSVLIQDVIWNDMDALNHVNNIVYLRYAESARINYLTEAKAFTAESNLVLAQSTCNYLLPVTYPDTLLIGVRTKKLGNTSLVSDYCFYSTAQQAVVATANTVIVRLDKSGSAKAPWTKTERDTILKFEQEVGHSPEV